MGALLEDNDTGFMGGEERDVTRDGEVVTLELSVGE